MSSRRLRAVLTVSRGLLPSRTPTEALIRPLPTARALSTTPRALRPAIAQPLPRGRAGGPLKVLPAFDWRTPPKPFPQPEVLIYDDPDEADQALASLSAKRLSLGGCETGPIRGATHAAGMRWNDQRSENFCEGVMVFSDEVGSVVVHLAKMNRAPSMIKQILEDDTVEKQIFGVGWFMAQFLHQPEFFDYARPSNVYCLRAMAVEAYPALQDTRGYTQSVVKAKLAPLTFEQRYVEGWRVYDWHTKRLQGAPLNQILNDAWFTHCAGVKIREKLVDRVERKVKPDFRLAHFKDVIRGLTEQTWEAQFRLDFDEFEAMRQE